nr:MAG: reverse transcriptase-like protein [Guiyang tombus-like virus 1]
MMKAIDKLWGSKTAIKGYTVEKVGQIMAEKASRFKEPVFVGLDASRFDQHCSRDALEWEHSVYNQVFNCPRLAELLSWQLSNRGTAYTSDGKVKYVVEGCRMSGDMNTSMGNYLIMSSLCYVYCQEVGLRAELANCGDDCVLFLEASDLGKLSSLPDWFTKMGYTMKVEKPVYNLEEIEFCQMHPVFTSRGWIMVRRPDTVVTKDCCVVRGGMTVSKLEDWLGAQRAGGLSLAGDVPVLSQFYKCFPEKTSDCLSDYAAPHKFQASQQYGSITDESRYSFWLAFGLTPDEQCAIEEDLVNFTFTTTFGEERGHEASLFDYCCR